MQAVALHRRHTACKQQPLQDNSEEAAKGDPSGASKPSVSVLRTNLQQEPLAAASTTVHLTYPPTQRPVGGAAAQPSTHALASENTSSNNGLGLSNSLLGTQERSQEYSPRLLDLYMRTAAPGTAADEQQAHLLQDKLLCCALAGKAHYTLAGHMQQRQKPASQPACVRGQVCAVAYEHKLKPCALAQDRAAACGQRPPVQTPGRHSKTHTKQTRTHTQCHAHSLSQQMIRREKASSL